VYLNFHFIHHWYKFVSKEKNQFVSQEKNKFVLKEKNTFVSKEKNQFVSKEKNKFVSKEKIKFVSKEKNKFVSKENLYLSKFVSKENMYIYLKSYLYLTVVCEVEIHILEKKILYLKKNYIYQCCMKGKFISEKRKNYS